MLRLERQLRVATEKRNAVVAERVSALESGHGLDVLTPRLRHERHAILTKEERAKRRAQYRKAYFERLKERETAAVAEIERIQGKIAKMGALPQVHVEIIRGTTDAVTGFVFPEKCCATGFKALHIAVLSKRLDQVMALLNDDAKAIVNCQDSQGCTALHLALSGCNFPMSKFLLSKGADFTIENSQGLNSFEFAISVGNYNAAAQILEECFTPWEIARSLSRKFIHDCFLGKHLAERSDSKLLMFLVIHEPHIFKTKKRKKKRRTVTNIEKFFHDFSGVCKLNRNYDRDFSKPALSKKKNKIFDDVWSHHKKRLDQELASETEEFSLEKRKIVDVDLEFVDEELESSKRLKRFSFGFLADFDVTLVKKWMKACSEWNLEQDADLISTILLENGSAITVAADELKEKLRESDFFTKKQQSHEDLDDARYLHQKEIVASQNLQRIKFEEEKRAQEDAVKNVNPNAGIKVSVEDQILFQVDVHSERTFTVCLQTVPSSPVLLRFQISHAREKALKSSFTISPSIATFTAANWDQPQTIRIAPINDDVLIRLKRSIDAGNRMEVIHKVQQTVSSTIDPSYRRADLPWTKQSFLVKPF